MRVDLSVRVLPAQASFNFQRLTAFSLPSSSPHKIQKLIISSMRQESKHNWYWLNIGNYMVLVEYVGTTVQYIFKFRLLYRAAHSICFLWYSTHCSCIISKDKSNHCHCRWSSCSSLLPLCSYMGTSKG